MHVEATLPSALHERHGDRIPGAGRAVALVLAGAAAGLGLAAAGLRRVTVEGESMRPGLLAGDRLLLVRLAPWARVAPGSVVAAADPRDPRRLLVKRVASVERDGRVVLLGDNAGASTDSRDFGPLPRRAVWGVARYRYAPPGRTGPLRRPSAGRARRARRTGTEIQ